MTIGNRGVLYGALTCGGCSKTFVANVFTVPNFKEKPSCQTCLEKLNDMRERLGLIRWTYPENTYPAPQKGMGNGIHR